MSVARRIAPVFLAGLLVVCSGSPREADSVTGRSIDAVLTAHTDAIMGLPGVVGIAQGLCDGAPCITVLLADSSAETRRRIPTRLEGYRVVTQVTGPIRPLPERE